MNKLLSPIDVADLLGVSPKTVYQKWRTWGLKGVRIGGGTNGPIRFRLKDVERLSITWED